MFGHMQWRENDSLQVCLCAVGLSFELTKRGNTCSHWAFGRLVAQHGLFDASSVFE